MFKYFISKFTRLYISVFNKAEIQKVIVIICISFFSDQILWGLAPESLLLNEQFKNDWKKFDQNSLNVKRSSLTESADEESVKVKNVFDVDINTDLESFFLEDGNFTFNPRGEAVRREWMNADLHIRKTLLQRYVDVQNEDQASLIQEGSLSENKLIFLERMFIYFSYKDVGYIYQPLMLHIRSEIFSAMMELSKAQLKSFTKGKSNNQRVLLSLLNWHQILSEFSGKLSGAISGLTLPESRSNFKKISEILRRLERAIDNHSKNINLENPYEFKEVYVQLSSFFNKDDLFEVVSSKALDKVYKKYKDLLREHFLEGDQYPNFLNPQENSSFQNAVILKDFLSYHQENKETPSQDIYFWKNLEQQYEGYMPSSSEEGEALQESLDYLKNIMDLYEKKDTHKKQQKEKRASDVSYREMLRRDKGPESLSLGETSSSLSRRLLESSSSSTGDQSRDTQDDRLETSDSTISLDRRSVDSGFNESDIQDSEGFVEMSFLERELKPSEFSLSPGYMSNFLDWDIKRVQLIQWQKKAENLLLAPRDENESAKELYERKAYGLELLTKVNKSMTFLIDQSESYDVPEEDHVRKVLKKRRKLLKQSLKRNKNNKTKRPIDCLTRMRDLLKDINRGNLVLKNTDRLNIQLSQFSNLLKKDLSNIVKMSYRDTTSLANLLDIRRQIQDLLKENEGFEFKKNIKKFNKKLRKKMDFVDKKILSLKGGYYKAMKSFKQDDVRLFLDNLLASMGAKGMSIEDGDMFLGLLERGLSQDKNKNKLLKFYFKYASYWNNFLKGLMSFENRDGNLTNRFLDRLHRMGKLSMNKYRQSGQKDEIDLEGFVDLSFLERELKPSGFSLSPGDMSDSLEWDTKRVQLIQWQKKAENLLLAPRGENESAKVLYERRAYGLELLTKVNKSMTFLIDQSESYGVPEEDHVRKVLKRRRKLLKKSLKTNKNKKIKRPIDCLTRMRDLLKGINRGDLVLKNTDRLNLQLRQFSNLLKKDVSNIVKMSYRDTTSLANLLDIRRQIQDLLKENEGFDFKKNIKKFNKKLRKKMDFVDKKIRSLKRGYYKAMKSFNQDDVRLFLDNLFASMGAKGMSIEDGDMFLGLLERGLSQNKNKNELIKVYFKEASYWDGFLEAIMSIRDGGRGSINHFLDRLERLGKTAVNKNGQSFSQSRQNSEGILKGIVDLSVREGELEPSEFSLSPGDTSDSLEWHTKRLQLIQWQKKAENLLLAPKGENESAEELYQRRADGLELLTKVNKSMTVLIDQSESYSVPEEAHVRKVLKRHRNLLEQSLKTNKNKKIKRPIDCLTRMRDLLKGINRGDLVLKNTDRLNIQLRQFSNLLKKDVSNIVKMSYRDTTSLAHLLDIRRQIQDLLKENEGFDFKKNIKKFNKKLRKKMDFVDKKILSLKGGYYKAMKSFKQDDVRLFLDNLLASMGAKGMSIEDGDMFLGLLKRGLSKNKNVSTRDYFNSSDGWQVLVAYVQNSRLKSEEGADLFLSGLKYLGFNFRDITRQSLDVNRLDRYRDERASSVLLESSESMNQGLSNRNSLKNSSSEDRTLQKTESSQEQRVESYDSSATGESVLEDMELPSQDTLNRLKRAPLAPRVAYRERSKQKSIVSSSQSDKKRFAILEEKDFEDMTEESVLDDVSAKENNNNAPKLLKEEDLKDIWRENESSEEEEQKYTRDFRDEENLDELLQKRDGEDDISSQIDASEMRERDIDSLLVEADSDDLLQEEDFELEVTDRDSLKDFTNNKLAFTEENDFDLSQEGISTDVLTKVDVSEDFSQNAFLSEPIESSSESILLEKLAQEESFIDTKSVRLRLYHGVEDFSDDYNIPNIEECVHSDKEIFLEALFRKPKLSGRQDFKRDIIANINTVQEKVGKVEIYFHDDTKSNSELMSFPVMRKGQNIIFSQRFLDFAYENNAEDYVAFLTRPLFYDMMHDIKESIYGEGVINEEYFDQMTDRMMVAFSASTKKDLESYADFEQKWLKYQYDQKLPLFTQEKYEALRFKANQRSYLYQKVKNVIGDKSLNLPISYAYKGYFADPEGRQALADLSGISAEKVDQIRDMVLTYEKASRSA
ncbi:hypothetical protein AB834_03845 [PVC group bacterium (ex Bugula neritina AB1)]|nr:hypothetical protein AB834_03845 [PVC group bacterium (ex Bugula neritina AB1)]